MPRCDGLLRCEENRLSPDEYAVLEAHRTGMRVALATSGTSGWVASSSRSFFIDAWPCWYVLYSCTSCWMGAKNALT